jgi:hypothetical protein
MAKKSRRARAKLRTGDQSSQKLNLRQEAPKSRGDSLVATSQAGNLPSAIRVNQYDYVAGDLIRIGIIAGTLILVLIILTFILR